MAKENLFPLKMLVFSMAALCVGMMLLFAGATYSRVKGGVCTGGEADLSAEGPVLDFYPAGNLMRVVTGGEPGVLKIHTLDPCQGAIVATMRLKVQE